MLLTGKASSFAGRDDGAGGGARRQPGDLVGRLAQALLQDGQSASDDHPLDATAVNGDGDVFAKLVSW